MKKSLMAAAAVAAALVAFPAAAQDGKEATWYASLGYSVIDADPFEFGAITGRVGGRGQHFGVELDGSFGIDDDEVFGVDVELEHAVAVYAVGFLPVGDNFELLARIGYGNVSIGAGGGSFDDDAFTYGLGAHWRWDEHNGIRGDWTRYEFDGGDADGFTVSYVRTF